MLANEPSRWSLTIALIRLRTIGVELRNHADTGVQLLCQQEGFENPSGLVHKYASSGEGVSADPLPGSNGVRKLWDGTL